MFQPSLSFLSQPIPEAMKTLSSFRSVDDLPETLVHGVVDTIEALMDCFPDVQREYHRIFDLNVTARNDDFNCIETAQRLLAPAVEAATYPLQTEHCLMSVDTPLAEALTPDHAMMLLRESYKDVNANHNEHEWEVLYQLMLRLLDGHPELKATVEQGMDSGEDFDYFAVAYAGMAEANDRTDHVEPELAMAA
ncbi:hypothetical protein NG697_12410 [Pseudarthrobacter sp. MDT3-26]|uniref:hypothetical protein n=1 Tax=Pseudarthrobacter raffinosi TaxID=2953651 RepID=UPI00208F8A4F|nr:hypothetical protein [Pseudarthrobacter sp. MDT3-26]MCO4263714.1 hypothetical protein [Pseudarthrobacter sp. MDT3-26]